VLEADGTDRVPSRVLNELLWALRHGNNQCSPHGGTDLHCEQEPQRNVACWLRAQRHDLPPQRIDLGVQRGDALTLPHVLR
jgi:hypothetical protein